MPFATRSSKALWRGNISSRPCDKAAGNRAHDAVLETAAVGVPPPVTASTRCRFQYCTDASLSPSHQISLKASVCGTKSSAQIAATAPARR